MNSFAFYFISVIIIFTVRPLFTVEERFRLVDPRSPALVTPERDPEFGEEPVHSGTHIKGTECLHLIPPVLLQTRGCVR